MTLEGGFPLACLLLLHRLLDPHHLVGRLRVGLHLPQGSHPLESPVLGSLESLLLVLLVCLGTLCDQFVTLGPGVRLDVRFLRVASVLGLLLLPLATQICGKRVFGMTKGIDDV